LEVFCLYNVEKQHCLSVELMDWLNIRLIGWWYCGIAPEHRDCGYLERLEQKITMQTRMVRIWNNPLRF